MTTTASSGRRVLVTGGGGFLGRHVVDRLAARGDDVRVLQRFGRLVAKGVRFVTGDVRNERDVADAVDGCDAVVHLAAAFNAADPANIAAINEHGTRRVAEACAATGAGRLVVVSSAEVYGNPAEVPCSETTPPAPLTAFARSKLAGERHAERVHRETGLPVTILRPTTLVGAECVHPILWSLFETARRRRTQALIGDGSHRVHLVDVGDAADAVVAALDDPEAMGIYNVAGPEATPLREVCRIVYELSGTEPQIRPLAEPEGHMIGRIMVTTMRLELLGTYLVRADADFVLDTRAARTKLHWNPRRGTEAVLASAYGAHLEQMTGG